jgi:serine carboxypeptidase-like clade 2
LYEKLIKSGLRIWKFSGDTDAVVPITGTLFWINKLQNEFSLRTLVPWRVWYKDDDGYYNRKNAGMYWRLNGLTFVSVRGAGHMVPTDQP